MASAIRLMEVLRDAPSVALKYTTHKSRLPCDPLNLSTPTRPASTSTKSHEVNLSRNSRLTKSPNPRSTVYEIYAVQGPIQLPVESLVVGRRFNLSPGSTICSPRFKPHWTVRFALMEKVGKHGQRPAYAWKSAVHCSRSLAHPSVSQKSVFDETVSVLVLRNYSIQ